MKEDVDRTLQKISQLRSLVQTLPHIPTRHEEVLLEIFESFTRPGVSSGQMEQSRPRGSTSGGISSLLARRRFEVIVAVGNHVGLDLLRSDRTLSTYHQAASQIMKSRP